MKHETYIERVKKGWFIVTKVLNEQGKIDNFKRLPINVDSLPEPDPRTTIIKNMKIGDRAEVNID